MSARAARLIYIGNKEGIIARAYALAETGRFCGVNEISRALKSEGIRESEIHEHLAGKGIRRDLATRWKKPEGVS